MPSESSRDILESDFLSSGFDKHQPIFKNNFATSEVRFGDYRGLFRCARTKVTSYSDFPYSTHFLVLNGDFGPVYQPQPEPEYFLDSCNVFRFTLTISPLTLKYTRILLIRSFTCFRSYTTSSNGAVFRFREFILLRRGGQPERRSANRRSIVNRSLYNPLL